ncbi:family 43 glycosylhydrolase [Rathayibacter sp. SD072]|uniref:family 43 glycosylhydrolase n=1 Tax=Rathayibacter sp. SD072 TaxID=2781731 RepID=UPI001A9566C4|nr:family 43 glycosylhydrolase [Rathayibacter sp. SD072]MBO0984974.1 family 43 glycosylhydrolase [Rathayibacter sp. SD072]
MRTHRETARKGRFGLRLLATAALTALLVAPFAAQTSSAAEQELVVNGGFENGISGWFVNNGNAADAGVIATTADARTGAASALVSGRTTTGAGAMQDLSGKVVAGQTYQVKAQIKYENAASPATKQFFATMHYGGGSYTNLASVTATKGQWATISGSFTVPAGQSVATARLFFETPWTATPSAAPETHLMDYKLDDVSLIGAAPPAPASRTIEVVGKQPGDHNPLIGWKFGADGFGFVENGRAYMYMTNDTQGYAPDPATGVSPAIDYGKINQITVISSDDLVNWTDHGEIQVAGSAGVAPFTGNSWAPGMAKKTVNGVDKYFLYYANGGGSSNVITGDSPVGPWTSQRTSTLINASTPGAEDVAWKFDPAPLIDDDGQGYLFFGGGPASTALPAAERFNNPKNIRVIQLGDDMISTEGTSAVVDAPVAFEAAQVFEREGKYYLSYSSHFGGADFGGNQTRVPGYPGGGEIGYMISDDPMAWPKEAYAGVMFPNQSRFFGAGTGGNNHQSVFELGGKYYFTYHAPTLNKRITGDTTQGYRSPHIQELQFNADGTVQQVVGDYAGVDQVKDFEPFRTFPAETIGWSKGIATAPLGTPTAGAAQNLVLKDLDAGDWTALSSVDFGDAGAATVTARAKALQAGGTITVRLDSETGPVAGTVPVDGTIGDWTEATAALSGATGVHDVYFSYSGPTGDLFELDTFAFTEGEAAPALDIAASATTRCIAGKAFLTVKATNGSDVPVGLTFESTSGSKSFASVGAGATVSHAFTTRQAVLPAGAVTVSATATIDGAPVETEVSAPYAARPCS